MSEVIATLADVAVGLSALGILGTGVLAYRDRLNNAHATLTASVLVGAIVVALAVSNLVS
ncbi:MAG: hypothetical protein ACOCT0_00945 [Halobacteriota archaeon]